MKGVKLKPLKLTVWRITKIFSRLQILHKQTIPTLSRTLLSTERLAAEITCFVHNNTVCLDTKLVKYNYFLAFDINTSALQAHMIPVQLL